MSGCTGSGKRVQILLSTYNGEKYLEAQLKSYIALEGWSNCKVLIRDDGSTDSTPDILRDYMRQPGFTVLFGQNIGVNASYAELIKMSDASCQYFAFSDQDDVWLSGKIALASKLLDAETERHKPLLFASRSKIVDENLAILGSSLTPQCEISFFNAMVQNICPGHTQVFNIVAREFLLQADLSKAHVLDWWTYLLASGLGQVLFSPEYTVLHRQHGNNAVGYQLNPVRRLSTRLKRVRSHEAAAITRQLEHFLHAYGASLPEEYRRELFQFIHCQDSFFKRIQYALGGRFFRQTLRETMLVRALYAAGKYRIKD